MKYQVIFNIHWGFSTISDIHIYIRFCNHYSFIHTEPISYFKG